MRARYWERIPLDQMTGDEWEGLCDGCGKCCLLKLEDEDTREVEFTAASCRLLDIETCRCAHYKQRKTFVPDCVVLTPKTLKDTAYFMPRTCAYRLLFEGKPLPGWHPLVTGDRDSTHDAGASVRGWAIPEFEIDEDDLEDYVLTEQYQ